MPPFQPSQQLSASLPAGSNSLFPDLYIPKPLQGRIHFDWRQPPSFSNSLTSSKSHTTQNFKLESMTSWWSGSVWYFDLSSNSDWDWPASSKDAEIKQIRQNVLCVQPETELSDKLIFRRLVEIRLKRCVHNSNISPL